MGASTPIEQFQEVISHMENITEEIIKTETVEANETVAQPEQTKVAVSAKSEMEKAFDNIKPNKATTPPNITAATI